MMLHGEPLDERFKGSPPSGIIIIVDKPVIRYLPVDDKCCQGKEQIDP